MLRVFISHSAKGETATFLTELASALRDDGHQVLLDRDCLELGVDWRSMLNMWMGGCDAAIVVLSADALESTFVLYETSILSYREDMDPGFALFPVLLHPVTFEAVEASEVSVTMLQRLQSVAESEDGGDAIARIRAALLARTPAQVPLDQTARRLRKLLLRLTDDDKREHLADLGVPLPPWIPGDDLTATLAMSMLGAGLARSVDFLRAVRDEYPGAGELENLIDLIACSWVDQRSVREIPRAALQEQPVSTNARYPSVARMYVIRAALEAKKLAPSNSWIFAEVDGIAGDLDELQRQVLTRLTVPFGVDDADEVRAEIAIKRRGREPVFVALPAQGLTAATLQALCAALKGVVFFVLTGAERPAQDLLDLALWLEPKLEADAEAAFSTTYNDQRPYLLQGHR